MSEKSDLVDVLEEVMEWIKNWDVPFLEDDEWQDTEAKVKAALAKAQRTP